MTWSYFGWDNEPWETVVLVCLAVLNGLAFVYAVYVCPPFCKLGSTPCCSFRSKHIIPLLSILLLYSCITLALGDSISSDGVAASIGTVAQAAITPLFLVTVFEMTYAVHKRRSVKFCGIVFDQGHRINTEPCSWFLRNFVRIIALGLFIWGIIVYFQLGKGPDDSTAGSGGIVDFPGSTSQFILTVLPGLIMAFIALFLSCYLWKYGNDASLIVHATVCNPWLFLFLGTLLLIAGNCFPASCCFQSMRTMGQTALLICILITYREVEREVEATERFGEFLAEENRKVTLAGLKKKGIVASGAAPREVLAASWHARGASVGDIQEEALREDRLRPKSMAVVQMSSQI